MVDIPPRLRQSVSGRAADVTGGVDGDTWLDSLPHAVATYLQRWELRVDGPARAGENALVLPVRSRTGPAALKLSWPHDEARHEHLALRLWAGEGAVRLLAADPAAYVLLLERLDADRPLTTAPVLDACEVLGSLLARLDRPPHPRFDTVAGRAPRWRAVLAAGSPAVPQRLTEQALAELDALVADLDLDSPYPGEGAEGQRGRAGGPKRAHLPDAWLESRDVDEEFAGLLRQAELSVSGG